MTTWKADIEGHQVLVEIHIVGWYHRWRLYVDGDFRDARDIYHDNDEYLRRNWHTLLRSSLTYRNGHKGVLEFQSKREGGWFSGPSRRFILDGNEIAKWKRKSATWVLQP